MKIDWVTVGAFQENSYLLSDPVSRRAVLVDPGDEPARILALVTESRATVEAIWLTHAHLDHIGAVAGVQRSLGSVPVYLHPEDLPLYRRASYQAALYGLQFDQPADPDRTLADGQELTVGTHRFVVRHTPGHAPGHVVFLGDRVMIGGDLLFAGSIGRTDLPFSNPAAMETSLVMVSALAPEIAVYPGHGPPTNIATELATNPYLVHLDHVR